MNSSADLCISTTPKPTSAAHAHDATPPALTRSTTVPLEIHSPSPRATRSHLAPEDAFNTLSPTRRQSSAFDPHGHANGITDSAHEPLSGRLRPKMGSRSRSRRRRRNWKKLLWVKQSYPDNYTDQATFLENLQLNPRLQPYEFWPLVADTTVILQQVCSVTIFVVCFVGIFQERVSPVAVVGWGSFATLVGWLLWDWWVGQEEEVEDEVLQRRRSNRHRAEKESIRKDRPHSTALLGITPSAASSVTNLAAAERSYPLLAMRQSHSVSATSLQSAASQTSTTPRHSSDSTEDSKHRTASPARGGRSSLRLSTIKSAILIYFTLLGLSPILKSLTRSTSSDSIWAMSFWLLAINIFFYDYSSGVGVKFPASLSTNAALMASTVLASRLPSTGQVFSLTLFSIEVFGLFPVFRRYARHQSWRYHLALSIMLVIGAGAGVGFVLGGDKDGPWPWKSGLLGVLVAALIAIVAMGGCSWWLISLQKYKNAINGPWDQARPIIISRRFWDEE
ncbi:phosphatidylinositol N-acetylglucosaminyltransferase-domain-containing protein [Xylariomycetidae sp. FL0641]|nr:phosphatidylinositol N-acetylglucosaminyltransferase-domain-containing protein [Xylariomycetidae sp. FL0641]